MSDERRLIRDLVEDWAVWRDAGDWERFATVWHEDGFMMATWFQGPAREFIRVSREGFERGVSILHFLGGTSIDLAGERAIAQTKMTISQRAEVHGVECDVLCTGRFYDFLEKRDGRWGIVLRQPIYEKDRLDPLDPAANLTLDTALLKELPARLPSPGLCPDPDRLRGQARHARPDRTRSAAAVPSRRRVARRRRARRSAENGRLSRFPIRRPPSSVLLAIGMVLLATNLRPAAAGIGPLIDRIRAGNGLSATGAGVLVTLPVLCFGALAPIAPVLSRRIGAQATAAAALVVLLLGLLVRLIPGVGFLFLGTALAGAAIAVGNVLLPVLARRSFPDRVGLITGLYTTALVGFAALSAGISAPVADAFGGGWRPGLAIWALPAAIALLVWAPQLVRRTPEGTVSPHAAPDRVAGARALLHDRVAWAVTLFFATQSAAFYATLAWLPSVFQSHGKSTSAAGFLLSLALICGLIPALAVPSLATRMRDQTVLVLACVALVAAGWLGVILAPTTLPYLWVVLLGIGQNASFPLALTLIVLRGGSVTSTAGLSTLVQSIGYLLAAVAPLAIGAVHDLSGSWTPALIVFLGLLVPQTVAGIAAARDRTVTPVAAR